jgi:hypothetical protein
VFVNGSISSKVRIAWRVKLAEINRLMRMKNVVGVGGRLCWSISTINCEARSN